MFTVCLYCSLLSLYELFAVESCNAYTHIRQGCTGRGTILWLSIEATPNKMGDCITQSHYKSPRLISIGPTCSALCRLCYLVYDIIQIFIKTLYKLPFASIYTKSWLSIEATPNKMGDFITQSHYKSPRLISIGPTCSALCRLCYLVYDIIQTELCVYL